MPNRNDDNDLIVDEETALLSHTKGTPKPTPLPWFQISIVMLVQLCEPITSQSIFPYINQLISELDITGGDKRKVGYYAGIIESLFFVTQAMTVMQWSRLSDYIGRKPVLLTGLMGLCISILCFGLSRTFWGLVVSRCVCGMLNGNAGVMKSMMGELTDSTNRADGFYLITVIWGVGSTLGSLMGGTLSKPHDRFPTMFGGPFWEKYPYFLPCVAAASFVSVASMVAFAFLKETLQKNPPAGSLCPETENALCVQDGAGLAPHSLRSRHDPVPIRELFSPRVILSISSYCALAFLGIALFSLLPLFFAMPIEIGGLGLTPPTIGYIFGGYGATTGTLQVLFFARIVRRIGIKQVVVNGISVFIPIFCLFPVINIVARRLGTPPFVWMLLAVQLSLMVFIDMTYGCIFMYITSAAPNKRSLGSTNGLAQTTVSVVRAIGPAMATSLFSFSVEQNILGGYGVYAFLTLLSALALLLVMRLPKGEWKDGAD